ncbi:hypothetical protein ZWY2020_013985 [Hordeum vulgare]|nr:hypothetical protein ZWY2020_013985 [Hordeum vulgare]
METAARDRDAEPTLGDPSTRRASAPPSRPAAHRLLRAPQNKCRPHIGPCSTAPRRTYAASAPSAGEAQRSQFGECQLCTGEPRVSSPKTIAKRKLSTRETWRTCGAKVCGCLTSPGQPSIVQAQERLRGQSSPCTSS